MKTTTKDRRKLRVRAKIRQRGRRMRLSVFRSQRYLYAQIIDDNKGETKIAVTSKQLKEKGSRLEQAKALGKLLAEQAVKMGICEVVFDRGVYKYHGRVKALAEGAREGGLNF